MNAVPLRIFVVCVCLWFAQASAATRFTAPDARTADGGLYYGPLLAGKLHGHGRLEWENGAYYQGSFEQGLYSGSGVLRLASGEIYKGHFRRGLMSGRGRFEYPDGTVYVGEFRNDLFNGRGRLQTADKEVYEGTFRDGRFDGEGRYAALDLTYQGQFRRGQYSGRGETLYNDGNKYRGEYLHGRYHGKGRFERPDGQVYDGDFAKGDFTGAGTHTTKTGARHEGRFVNWRPQGRGRYLDNWGNVFEGEFVDGELTGRGRLTAKAGVSYEGEFKSWRPHGQGTLRLPNGDVYTGGFANGNYEGEGTLVYAKPQPDGRTRDSGVWRYGYLRNEEQERQAQINVETALYNQRALLDKALGSLLPHDPSKINLYLLAIGGDGSQEVFRREVQFVREQFDRRFRTEGRSIALINSRNTVATVPMATVSSIRESLRALASRMDRERDILFLFLTSHGSEEHEFTLAQNNMRLRGLRAKDLAELLAEAQVRWKVIVISACYSGGAIDALKNDHTMIMTAARHDRRSFGCSDDSELTYFGRAFFKEALPASVSFQDAFSKAEALISTWESADQKGEAAAADGHSMPQLAAPAAVTEYLQRWWTQMTQDAPATRVDSRPAETPRAAAQGGVR